MVHFGISFTGFVLWCSNQVRIHNRSADGVEVVYRGNEENRIRVVMNHNGYKAVKTAGTLHRQRRPG
ncbi:MAG: hypothetical protein PUF75_09075 [Coprococcus sp.]|nr:hypothetical protein [Coprococcus sp.]